MHEMHPGMSLSDKLNASANQKKSFPDSKGLRGIARFKHINKDGLQMGMSGDYILCNIFRPQNILFSYRDNDMIF